MKDDALIPETDPNSLGQAKEVAASDTVVRLQEEVQVFVSHREESAEHVHQWRDPWALARNRGGEFALPKTPRLSHAIAD